jgi:putative hemolysin
LGAVTARAVALTPRLRPPPPQNASDEEQRGIVREALAALSSLGQRLERWELQRLLAGPYDERGARLTLSAGAGGVDAMDWTEMLERMYIRWVVGVGGRVGGWWWWLVGGRVGGRWCGGGGGAGIDSVLVCVQAAALLGAAATAGCSVHQPQGAADAASALSQPPSRRWCEAQGYKVQVVERSAGEEAGVKSVELEVEGRFAYGYLRGEKGTHRWAAAGGWAAGWCGWKAAGRRAALRRLCWGTCAGVRRAVPARRLLQRSLLHSRAGPAGAAQLVCTVLTRGRRRGCRPAGWCATPPSTARGCGRRASRAWR